jgi:hypothetical protein
MHGPWSHLAGNTCIHMLFLSRSHMRCGAHCCAHSSTPTHRWHMLSCSIPGVSGDVANHPAPTPVLKPGRW